VPWGFRKLTRYIHERYTKPYGIPIWITECGFTPENEHLMSFEERIHDTQREDYYSGYLKELCEAVRDDGIDVSGFMAWSLME
jgi:beta-glucosidase